MSRVEPQRHRRGLVALAASTLFLVTLVLLAPTASASPNSSCLTCHTRVAFEPSRFAESVHGDLACADCHRGFSGDPHGQAEVPPPEDEWLQTVISVEAISNAGDAWAACGTCHPDVMADMAESQHLVAAVEHESADGAFCRDCHGAPHYIEPAPRGARARLDFVHRTCVPCHSDPELVATWDLNPDVVFTYEESIHGRAARLGAANAPTCVDCHEAHRVMGGHHPESPLAPTNRASTCGQCHEGANDTFASIFSHTRITREGRPAEYWATFFFVSLTLITILLLMLHMLLDLITGLRQQLSKR